MTVRELIIIFDEIKELERLAGCWIDKDAITKLEESIEKLKNLEISEDYDEV